MLLSLKNLRTFLRTSVDTKLLNRTWVMFGNCALELIYLSSRCGYEKGRLAWRCWMGATPWFCDDTSLFDSTLIAPLTQTNMRSSIKRIWSFRTTLHILCHTTVTKARRRLRAQVSRQRGWQQACVTTTARTEQHLHNRR